jgi:hypothetical protein
MLKQSKNGCGKMTIGDLCQAIEERHVRPTIRDGVYEISNRELRRLRTQISATHRHSPDTEHRSAS